MGKKRKRKRNAAAGDLFIYLFISFLIQSDFCIRERCSGWQPLGALSPVGTDVPGSVGCPEAGAELQP